MPNIAAWFKKQREDHVWAWRKLGKDHVKLLSIAVIAFVFTISTTIYNVFSSKAGNITHQTISSVLVNLGTSILAAFLIEIIAQYRRLIQTKRKQRLFKGFFGIKSDIDEVAIVLPKFVADNEPVDKKQQTMWNVNKPDKEIVGYAVQPDVMAAAELVTAFGEVGLPPPIIMWDDEAVKQLETAQPTIHTFIAIGLFTNLVTQWLSQRKRFNNLYRIDASNDVSRAARPFQLRLTYYRDERLDPEEWQYFETEPGLRDYTLISKIFAQRNVSIFICGGIDAIGTRKGGAFLHKNWEKLRLYSDSEADKQIEDSQFAAIFEINLKREDVQFVRAVVDSSRQTDSDPRVSRTTKR